jgi:hypothetical protein
MSSYFRSLLAEVLPGWAFWRSSPRPARPLDGAPSGKGVEAARKANEGSAEDDEKTDNDQPPADPDSLNRRL